MITPDYTIAVNEPKDADLSFVVNCTPYNTEVNISLMYAENENSQATLKEEWRMMLNKGDVQIRPKNEIDKFGIYWYDILDVRNHDDTTNNLNSKKIKIVSSGVYTNEYNEPYN